MEFPHDHRKGDEHPPRPSIHRGRPFLFLCSSKTRLSLQPGRKASMKTHQELSDQIGQLGTQLSTAQSDLAKTRADLDRVRDDQQLLTGLLSTSAASLNLPWNIVTVDSAGSVGTFHCHRPLRSIQLGPPLHSLQWQLLDQRHGRYRGQCRLSLRSLLRPRWPARDLLLRQHERRPQVRPQGRVQARPVAGGSGNRFRQEVFGGRRAPQNSDLIDVPIAPPKEFP